MRPDHGEGVLRRALGAVAAVGVAGLIAAGGAVAVPSVSETVIGLGGTQARAIAINGAGQVVGDGSIAGDSETHPFSWTRSGGAIDLGTLGGTYGSAVDVNESGEVTGTSATAAGEQHAFIYSGGVMTDLGTLGGTSSNAVAINDDGTVVGTSSLPGDAEQHAFVWTTADGMIDLGTLGTGLSSTAQGISDNGLVTGSSATDGYNDYAGFFWTAADGIQPIPDSVNAYALNDAGQVVINSTSGAVSLWTRAGGAVPMAPSVPGGSLRIFALSDTGKAVGQQLTPGVNNAITWTQAGGTVALRGDDFGYAASVSPNGQYVGGSTLFPLDPGQNAFAWTATDGIVNLDTTASDESYADAANDAGQFAGHRVTAGVSEAVLWELGAAVDPDADHDGVMDTIDSGAGQWNDPVAGNPATTGSIMTTGGLSVLVEDAADPDGVRITTGPGTGAARLSVCGFATITLPANAVVVVTCGSVTVRVVQGPVTIDLGALASVTVPSGATAKVSEVPGGTFSVQSIAGGALTVKVNGVTSTVPSGSTRPVAAWRFVGFAAPVDNGGVLNSTKAGQAVPLKWRVLDAHGSPVTGLTRAIITAQSLTCATSAPVDELEEIAPGASALKDLGNGNYQLNWKTPTSYAGSCRTLKLDIGDGVTHDALFRFK